MPTHSMVSGSIRVIDRMCFIWVRYISTCNSAELDGNGSAWLKAHWLADWRRRAKPDLLGSEFLMLLYARCLGGIWSSSPTTSPFGLVHLPIFHHRIGWPLNWDDYHGYLLKLLLNTTNCLLFFAWSEGVMFGEVLGCEFQSLLFYGELNNLFYRLRCKECCAEGLFGDWVWDRLSPVILQNSRFDFKVRCGFSRW